MELERIFLAEAYTIGKLFIDNIYFCDTLEDRVRDYNKDGDLLDPGEQKVFGETAIPYGVYTIVLDYSPKFKTIMPHILSVPHFEGIRIHWGNISKDTHGCILVGKNTERGKVTNSRKTYADLISKMVDSEEDKFVIEIR